MLGKNRMGWILTDDLVEQNESFRPPFSKGGSFQRRRLWLLSAESEISQTKRSFEGLKGNFSHEEKFPFKCMQTTIYSLETCRWHISRRTNNRKKLFAKSQLFSISEISSTIPIINFLCSSVIGVIFEAIPLSESSEATVPSRK